MSKDTQGRNKISLAEVLTLQGDLVSRRARRWDVQERAKLGDAVRRKVGITWDWAEAGRGVLCALPAPVIMLAVDLSLGMVFAIATLPVAMLGVPPQRRQRPRLGLVGLAFAVSYALGSVLGLWELAAVATLTVLAFAGVLFSVRKPAARLLPALLLPGLALG